MFKLLVKAGVALGHSSHQSSSYRSRSYSSGSIGCIGIECYHEEMEVVNAPAIVQPTVTVGQPVVQVRPPQMHAMSASSLHKTLSKKAVAVTPVQVVGSTVSEPLRSCTDGFVYDSDLDCCFRDVVTEPMFSCVQAGGVLEGDQCKCHRTKVVKCTEGYRYNPMTDSCDSQEMTPMIPSCAHVENGELTDDGRHCVHGVVVPSRPLCPKGTKLVNSVCVRYVPVPQAIVYSCPDGWLNIGDGLCEMQEEVTCEHVDITTCKSKSCGFQKFKPCKSPCKVLKKNRRNLSLCDKSLGVCDKPLDAEVVCQAADCMMEYGTEYIQEKEVSVKTTCTRTTHMTARITCAQGEVNKRGGCCIAEYVEPVLDCPTGSALVEGKCIKRAHILSDFLCPIGYAVDCAGKKLSKATPGKCECVRKESVPALRECPPGSTPSADGMCELFLAADIYCPDQGFQLGQNGLCLGKEFEPVRLEYTVTYVKHKECIADVCEEKALKSKVQHKGVFKMNGINTTECDINPCVNLLGKVVQRRRRVLLEDKKKDFLMEKNAKESL